MSGAAELNWLNILGVSLALAMDAFAVSIAAGLTVASVTYRHTFRLAFHFGLFQFMMPVFGWWAGRRLAAPIQAFDHWAAFGLLTFVGAKMLWDSRHKTDPTTARDPTRGWMLVMLSVATSMDALAVGLSMALMGVSVWLPAAVIGLTAAAFSTVGITFASRFSPNLGRWAEAIGGCVLILIGVRIVLSHCYP